MIVSGHHAHGIYPAFLFSRGNRNGATVPLLPTSISSAHLFSVVIVVTVILVASLLMDATINCNIELQRGWISISVWQPVADT